MECMIGMLILLLDLIAIGDTIRTSLPVEKKILWVVLILFLPVVGMVLYFLVGRPGK